MAKNVIEMVAKLVSDTGEFVGGINTAVKKLDEFGDKVGEIAQGLKDFADKAALAFAAVGTATAGALGAAAASAAQADAAFAKVLTQIPKHLRENAAFVEGLKKAGYDIGAKFGIGFEDAANAMFEGLGGGIPAEEIAAAVESSARLALAGQATVQSVQSLMVSLRNAYGESFEGYEKVQDQIFQAQLLGKTTIQELSDSAGKLAATFANAGISTSELFAAISTGTQTGIGTSEMVAYLGQLVKDLAAPSNEKAAELIKKLGVNFSYAELRSKGLKGKIDEVNAALKAHEGELIGTGKAYASMTDALAVLFPSVESLKAANALAVRDGEAFASTLNATAESAGSVAAALAVVQENDPTLMFKQIKEEARGLVDAFGGEVLAGFGGFFVLVRDGVKSLREWAAANPVLVESLVHFLEVIAGVSFLASALFAGISLLLGVILALSAVGLPLLIAGFVLFAPLLAGIVALAGFLYANWEKIGAWAMEHWPAIRDAVVNAATAIWTSLQQAATVIGTALQGAGDRFLAWLTENLPTILAKVQEFAKWIADVAVPWVTSAILKVGEWLEWLGKWFTEVGPTAFATFGKAWDLIVAGFETGAKMLDLVVLAFKRLYEIFTGKTATTGNLVGTVKEFYEGIGKALDYTRSLVEFWGKVLEKVKAVAETIGSIGSTAANLTLPGSSIIAQAFASGGIVSRPTLALAGEAGPEAFVPLDGGKIPVRVEGGGAGGFSIGALNIYQQPGEDSQRLADRVADAIFRRRGRV